MNILDKFENVTIENKNKIKEEDRDFCIVFDNIYKTTLECYKNTLNNLVLLYNKQKFAVPNEYSMCVSIYGNGFSISNVIEAIHDLKETFINKICYYFSKEYNVTIEKDKIYQKYKDIELSYDEKYNKDKTLNINLIKYVYLDYNIILDEIFIQLDGCTFWEKAVNEIIQKARVSRHYYEYRKYWNYDIKGKVIKFRFGIDDIKPALFFYDSNETKILGYLSCNRIEEITKHNNGNTDVKFVNSSYALEFAKKYLGYIGNN